MRTDRRQIQTAVLGSADSEEPLMLPMEAIELDAFRHNYPDTFWCGTLLGGCGGQLTTKLYTDRACHFAHHPDPDGLPHMCGRHARGVNSADHLYVKAAAAAWLTDRGEQASFEYARPNGAPLGSVVDVRWKRGALRVHLDQVVAPEWDTGMEPVLGTGLLVDPDTLIRRWYVHRIRLDSEGTVRRVRIGTEAFARPTEWFALDDCAMTERGLSTPAVERIIRSRSTPPPSRRPSPKSRKVPDVRAQAQVLLRRLDEARTVGSVIVVNRVYPALAALDGVDQETRIQIDAALAGARTWLEVQTEVRRQMFCDLSDAVAEQNAPEARALLVRVNATAAHDRTDDEDQVAGVAAEFISARVREQQEAVWQRKAEAEAEAAARSREARKELEAIHQVRATLRLLRRQGRSMSTVHKCGVVEELAEVAALAGSQLTPSERNQVGAWQARVERERTPVPDQRAAVPPQSDGMQVDGRENPLPKERETYPHHRVARRYWYREPCPRCCVSRGQACINPDRVGSDPDRERTTPHAERLQPILDEREAKAKQSKIRSAARHWPPKSVTCPDCGAEPGKPCTTRGPHRRRFEKAEEVARKILEI
ncbi:zinc finger domain-containing protein [Streptomyces decoyicus]|uniref:zinc finger domain-containing protein n=1 Tax=Streptomyces decoyicus TaxID=249567 RepID=UPI00365662BF